MVDNLEYNTERTHLIIPEYGRHIQKMVAYTLNIADRDARTKSAQSIIAVMGNLNPHLRDVPDFQHKLWDQLFIISDFKLDVDAPYPKPSREELAQRPEVLEYPEKHSKFRFYGNHIKRMIDVATQWEEGDKKEGLVYAIANHMKKSFLKWNKDTVEDDVIFEHLFKLSNGKLNLKDNNQDLITTETLLKGKKRYKKNYKNHRNRKRN